MYCFGGHWASKFEASVAAPLVGPYYKGLIRLESGKPNTPSTKKINCMYIYIWMEAVFKMNGIGSIPVQTGSGLIKHATQQRSCSPGNAITQQLLSTNTITASLFGSWLTTQDSKLRLNITLEKTHSQPLALMATAFSSTTPLRSVFQSKPKPPKILLSLPGTLFPSIPPPSSSQVSLMPVAGFCNFILSFPLLN